jgi:hypothetical protein
MKYKMKEIKKKNGTAVDTGREKKERRREL